MFVPAPTNFSFVEVLVLLFNTLPYSTGQLQKQFGQSINCASTLLKLGVGIYGSNPPWLRHGVFEPYKLTYRF